LQRADRLGGRTSRDDSYIADPSNALAAIEFKAPRLRDQSRFGKKTGAGEASRACPPTESHGESRVLRAAAASFSREGRPRTKTSSYPPPRGRGTMAIFAQRKSADFSSLRDVANRINPKGGAIRDSRSSGRRLVSNDGMALRSGCSYEEWPHVDVSSTSRSVPKPYSSRRRHLMILYYEKGFVEGRSAAGGGNSRPSRQSPPMTVSRKELLRYTVGGGRARHNLSTGMGRT